MPDTYTKDVTNKTVKNINEKTWNTIVAQAKQQGLTVAEFLEREFCPDKTILERLLNYLVTAEGCPRNVLIYRLLISAVRGKRLSDIFALLKQIEQESESIAEEDWFSREIVAEFSDDAQKAEENQTLITQRFLALEKQVMALNREIRSGYVHEYHEYFFRICETDFTPELSHQIEDLLIAQNIIFLKRDKDFFVIRHDDLLPPIPA